MLGRRSMNVETPKRRRNNVVLTPCIGGPSCVSFEEIIFLLVIFSMWGSVELNLDHLPKIRNR